MHGPFEIELRPFYPPMRFRTKILLFLILGLILWLSLAKGLELLKERYLYSIINRSFQNLAEKNWDASLHISQIKGDILTNLKLKDVSLTNFKSCPEALTLRIDAINLIYRPFAILSAKFNAEFINPKIISNGSVLPLEISHHGYVSTITFNKKHLNAGDFQGIVLQNIVLNGFIDIEGALLLKRFKMYLVNVILNGRKIRIIHNSDLEIIGDVRLEINSRPASPKLSGMMDIVNAKWLVYGNKFRVNKGKILFTDINKSPYIEVEGETHLRGYEIFAKRIGVLDEAKFELISKPELSRLEIISLLVFGKKLEKLSDLEKERLVNELS